MLDNYCMNCRENSTHTKCESCGGDNILIAEIDDGFMFSKPTKNGDVMCYGPDLLCLFYLNDYLNHDRSGHAPFYVSAAYTNLGIKISKIYWTHTSVDYCDDFHNSDEKHVKFCDLCKNVF